MNFLSMRCDSISSHHLTSRINYLTCLEVSYALIGAARQDPAEFSPDYRAPFRR